MKAAIEREGGPFTLFGGEPLLVPERDLEDLWAWGLARFGSNAIQTNGTLINDNHIRMFKKYQVEVGISIDGPRELNDLRWIGSLERTRAATKKTEKAIERLCKEGIPPSLIITLHRYNATSDKLPIMHEWLRYLEHLGVPFARLHILETEKQAIKRRYALTTEENTYAFLSFVDLEQELTTLRFDVFKDMNDLLLGHDRDVTCVWAGCDPYTTSAVQGVEGNGQRTNCGRTNKEGIDFIKSDRVGYERYLALYHTPQEHGGCKGCRFFLMCRGQCPGTAIGGDWRNKSEHCEVWKALYRHLEGGLLDRDVIPISASPTRTRLEEAMLQAWALGSNPNMQDILENLAPSETSPKSRIAIASGKINGGSDSGLISGAQDQGERIIVPPGHLDTPHQDTPHSDHPHTDRTQHGDHNDQGHIDSVGHTDVPHGDRPHGDRPHGDRR
jgi:uncharacterized protein